MIVQATISCTYGTNKSDSAASCRDIILQNPACYQMSGYYWIDPCNTTETEPMQVYCDMEFLAFHGGWMRLAIENFTNNDPCPDEFNQVVVQGTTYCSTINGNTVAKWQISNFNCSFSEVRGYVLVDQKGLTDAFDQSNTDIDSNFVDGVTFSLLTPTSNRVHLYTYAVASTNALATTKACKCQFGSTEVPPIVQFDYMCDTGYKDDTVNIANDTTQLAARTLFTGEDCEVGRPPQTPLYSESSCCHVSGAPWFYRDLTTDWNCDIEVRIIEDDGNHASQLILVRELALYVR